MAKNTKPSNRKNKASDSFYFTKVWRSYKSQKQILFHQVLHDCLSTPTSSKFEQCLYVYFSFKSFSLIKSVLASKKKSILSQ